MYNGALYTVKCERSSKKAIGSCGFLQTVLPELVRKLFDNPVVECVGECEYLGVNIVEG